MRLEHLEYLVQLADTGSITQASKDLFTTQQNVSKMLRQLETEVGATFFVRSQKGITLTPAGQLMVDGARKMLIQLQQTLTNIHALEKQADVTGELHLYASMVTTFAVMSDIIQDFNIQYPHIMLQLHDTESATAMQLLTTAPQAIGILPIMSIPIFQDIYAPYLQQLNICPLIDDEFLCLVSNSSPLAREKSISLAHFVQYPLAMNQHYSTGNSAFLKLLHRYGDVKVAFSSNNPQLYLQAIISGQCIGLSTQRSSIKNAGNPSHHRLTTLPFREDMRFRISLVTASAPQLTPAGQAFLDFIQNRYPAVAS